MGTMATRRTTAMHRSHATSLESLVRTALITATLFVAGATAQCTQWSALGFGSNNTVLAVGSWANGDIAMGGVFTQAGTGAANRIARWNGTAWSALGAGTDNTVRSVVTLPNGDLIAGGDFDNAGGVPATRIARWDGTAWHPLGTGISTANPSGLYAVAMMPNGDVIAGGYFRAAGGVAANAIARWNGTSWSALGTGILATVFALHPLQNGDLLVGGNFSTAGGVAAPRIARWNGSTWSGLGTGITGFRVNGIGVLPNGDIVAAGAFTAAGGSPANNIARWDGSTWSALGAGMNGDVLTLSVMPNGDLLAGGQFSTAGGVTAHGLARWNGSTWSALGFAAGGQVYGSTTAPNGDRIVGGFFSSAGGVSAGRIARYASTCPAGVADGGGGCASTGGTNSYAATTLPWIGTTYRAAGTGLPASAVAVVVSGFATANIPLSSALPPSPVGCNVLVSPDVLDPLAVSGGAVATSIVIPASATLVGAVLHQQLVVLELDPVTSAVVENTVSNRLTVTVGAF